MRRTTWILALLTFLVAGSGYVTVPVHQNMYVQELHDWPGWFFATAQLEDGDWICLGMGYSSYPVDYSTELEAAVHCADFDALQDLWVKQRAAIPLYDWWVRAGREAHEFDWNVEEMLGPKVQTYSNSDWNTNRRVDLRDFALVQRAAR